MAAYISVPRDLTKVKSKVAFNLTKRQLICFGTAALIGVPLFFLLRDSGGNSAATLGMMAVMLPAFFLGMYEKNGQPLEKLLSYYVRARFLRPKIRPYKTENYYALLMKGGISLNWKENLPMIKLVHHEMVINSKFLEVPRSYYQRHLNASRVKRIAAEFDERIANAPKVSYRDGHYYVFDGQHTIAARKLLNNNSDLNIVCKVYSGLTEQEEALLFAQQTGISAPLTAGAKLRAKIHGGDPEAIAFQSATQRAGFGLSFNQSHAKWKIACIATAFGEYRQHGERIYTEALRVLAEAWEGDIDSLRSEVLQGVVRFIALYDHEYDPVRLIRQLKRTSPVTIYRSGQAMSGPNYQKYMHQILKAYNGSSRTKSLPIKQ